MLTRDLLRYATQSRRILPRFVDPKNQNLINLIKELIGLYSEGKGQSREELGEVIQPILNAYRSPLIAKGLNKLLLNRCDFQEAEEGLDLFRLGVFETASKRLAEKGMGDLEKYREVVAGDVNIDPDQLGVRLFSDLPDRQPLAQFRTITPQALAHRYNMAQVQGLLLNADRLEVEFQEPGLSKRRQLFRYLRFHRLLVRIQKMGDGSYHLTLDGPLSLLQNTRKYGFQLALFFPALVAMSRWRIEAWIKMKGQRQELSLSMDETSGLVTHLTQMSGYIPEEFEVFQKSFKKGAKGWHIKNNAPLLDLGKQEVAAPDFSFQHDDGTLTHLELFHAWHKAPLIRRLESMGQAKKKPPLIIGVDRALSKEKEVSEMLEKDPWFDKNGFLFNQFPPVKRVIGVLEVFRQG
ncbi:MAG: DUF790 family protein [Magnetococcales bacterium]|nr:DUF790 family protein [Magnetococcales bacterium]